MLMTYDEARAKVKELADRDFIAYCSMRRAASASLEEDLRESYGEDSGFDIGSSDVSIRVIDMVRCGELSV